MSTKQELGTSRSACDRQGLAFPNGTQAQLSRTRKGDKGELERLGSDYGLTGTRRERPRMQLGPPEVGGRAWGARRRKLGSADPRAFRLARLPSVLRFHIAKVYLAPLVAELDASATGPKNKPRVRCLRLLAPPQAGEQGQAAKGCLWVLDVWVQPGEAGQVSDSPPFMSAPAICACQKNCGPSRRGLK